MDKSYTETLADFASNVGYDDLPAEAVHDAKRLILDTIACSVGSHFTDAGKIVAEVGRERGGTPESTILVTGDKTSCGTAAYVNAALANLMDFDDSIVFAGGHLAQCVVLPALALAERQKSSGKEMIAAIAVGFEMSARIGYSRLQKNMVTDPATGKVELSPFSGQTYSVFGAAATAGKLLGFDGVKMAHAFGLAGYSAPVPTIGKYLATMGKWSYDSPPHGGVPMSKYTMYGAIAEAGVMGALLANKGFTGDRTVLDGERGFGRIIGSGLDFEKLVAGLGNTWIISDVALKPYPVGRDFQSAVWVFEKIAREHDLKPDEIEEIECGLFAAMAGHMNHATILNQIDSQMSLPYALAMVALGYEPGPAWENPARFRDPNVKALMGKVKAYAWPRADNVMKTQQAAREWRGAFPARVTVKARGEQYTGETEYTKGDPWFPETRTNDDEISNKFRNLAIGLLRTEHIDRAIETIYRLEALPDVGELVRYLT